MQYQVGILLQVVISGSVPFVEKTISLLNGIGTLVRNQLNRNVLVYFQILSLISLIYMTSPMYTVLGIVALQSVLKLVKLSLQTLFLCKTVLAILGPLHFHTYFVIRLPVSAKNPVGILLGIVLHLQTNLGSAAILMASGLPTHEYECPSTYLNLL